METFQLVVFIIGAAITAIIALGSIGPYLMDEKTRKVVEMRHPNDEVDFDDETPLNMAPKNNKEYILNDGSTVTIDATETEVEEKEVFDPFGDEVLKPQKSPAERMGGGIAELIRKRREEGVF